MRPRHDEFLERVHRELSSLGNDAASVASLIDAEMQRCGDLVPRSIARSAKEIERALARGGVLAARACVEALWATERCSRSSGIFGKDGPEPARGGRPTHQPSRPILILEVDRRRNVQLVRVDVEADSTTVIGEPRHARFFYYVYETENATLWDAYKASGSTALRVTKVFDDLRRMLGDEIFATSDSGSLPRTRVIRITSVPGMGIYLNRVEALTQVPRQSARRA